VNAREQDELRRLTDQAFALKGTGYLLDACAAITTWAETRVARGLDHLDQQRSSALEVLRQTAPILNQAEVLRSLREVGARELCGDCGEPDCRHDPDCAFRVRVAHGMHEGRARGLRAAEWRAFIEDRETRRAA
jgi:hypothetical protein